MTCIEICGGIAAGKTSFASIMANYEIEILYEDFKVNPFWKAFYTNPGKYIFETEITFLLIHYHQIKSSLETQNIKKICDFSFLLDLAYAKIGLSGTKLDSFEKVYSEVQSDLGLPSLLIYLRCDAQTELDRIKKRGRSEEESITLKFLDSLNFALENEVNRINEYTKVININSAEKDFVNDESVIDDMRRLIYDSISDE